MPLSQYSARCTVEISRPRTTGLTLEAMAVLERLTNCSHNLMAGLDASGNTKLKCCR